MFISFILIHSFCVILSLCDSDLCVEEVVPGYNTDELALFEKGYLNSKAFKGMVEPGVLNYCSMDGTMNKNQYFVNKKCKLIYVEKDKDFQNNVTRVRPSNERDCYVFISQLKYPKITVNPSKNRTTVWSYRRVIYAPSGKRWYYVAVSALGIKNKNKPKSANAYIYVHKN